MNDQERPVIYWEIPIDIDDKLKDQLLDDARSRIMDDEQGLLEYIVPKILREMVDKWGEENFKFTCPLCEYLSFSKIDQEGGEFAGLFECDGCGAVFRDPKRFSKFRDNN